jgi:hypothetical protein
MVFAGHLQPQFSSQDVDTVMAHFNLVPRKIVASMKEWPRTPAMF